MRWYEPTPARPFGPSPSEFAEAIHGYRHEFLNLLTPVSGWLQMENLPKARASVEKAIASLVADSPWSRLESPELEAALFLIKAEARRVGLSFIARVAVPAEPVHALEAAAGRDAEPSGSGQGLGAVAGAALALCRAVLRRHSAAVLSGAPASAEELHASVRVTPGRLELDVGLPGTGGPPGLWDGLEEEALSAAGFAVASRPGWPGVGVELFPGPETNLSTGLAFRSAGEPPLPGEAMAVGETAGHASALLRILTTW